MCAFRCAFRCAFKSASRCACGCVWISGPQGSRDPARPEIRAAAAERADRQAWRNLLKTLLGWN
eukprot:364681-Chlamydomonas_euryale.AAC.18